jgi:hypothetical protein
MFWPNSSWPNTSQSATSGRKARLWSTAAGSNVDYLPYLYSHPVKKDVLNSPDLLDFSLFPSDASFVKLNRGAYIQLDTASYGPWFTGFITSEPNLTYLGSRNDLAVYGYVYEASGEDYILNLKPLPLLSPFMNISQGQILKTLASVMAPEWKFDVSQVQDGLMMARYIVDPTQKWKDVVDAFCKAANYRFACRQGKLFFEPLDSRTAPLIIDGNGDDFTPANLSLTPSTDPIVNDAVVLGEIEPQDYMNEYFVGDGWNGKFPLIAACYGADTNLLFDETFTGSSIDTQQKWDVFDSPTQFIQVSNGFCNALGGNNNGQYDVWMQTQFQFPLEGSLRITHGEYDFVQSSDGVICGLWSGQPTNTLSSVLYGLKLAKTSVIQNGVPSMLIHPIVNGVTDTTQGGLLGNYDLRYVIRTTYSFQRSKRFTQNYSYLDASGVVQTVGQPMLPDTMTAETKIVAIDPETGTVIKQADGSTAFMQFSNTVPIGSDIGFASYIPIALNDLHCSFTGLTISTPLHAGLKVRPKGKTDFTAKLIGPNEIDSYDGNTPVATVVDSNQGATTRSSLLGRIQYNPGNAALEFFVDTVNQTQTMPNVGDLVWFTYRRAGAAIGRVQDKSSVAAESAAWGDNGLRSSVTSNMTPLPRTSGECEVAAQALVGDQGRQHWDGSYSLTNLFEATGEILSGTVLKFQNLPAQFPSTLTAESIKQVETTLSCLSPTEVFDMNIGFGRQSMEQKFLAKFTKPNTPWQPQDDAQIPNAIDINAVGTVFADDVVNPTLLSWDNGNYYLTANQDPPIGGGFEVRYTNDSWGCDDAKNLVMRTSGRAFQVPRTLRGQAVWIKAQDGRNHCMWSEDLTHWAQGSNQVNLLTNSQFQTPPVGGSGDVVAGWKILQADTGFNAFADPSSDLPTKFGTQSMDLNLVTTRTLTAGQSAGCTVVFDTLVSVTSGRYYTLAGWFNNSTSNAPAGVSVSKVAQVRWNYSDGSSEITTLSFNHPANDSDWVPLSATAPAPSPTGKSLSSARVELVLTLTNTTGSTITLNSSNQNYRLACNELKLFSDAHVTNAMDVNPDGHKSLISTLLTPAGGDNGWCLQTLDIPEQAGTLMVFSVSLRAASQTDVGKDRSCKPGV